MTQRRRAEQIWLATVIRENIPNATHCILITCAAAAVKVASADGIQRKTSWAVGTESGILVAEVTAAISVVRAGFADRCAGWWQFCYAERAVRVADVAAAVFISLACNTIGGANWGKLGNAE